MSLVAVVNFGTGNLRSVQKAIEHVADKRVRVIVTDNGSELAKADRVVFPGQGAIGTCLDAMEKRDLRGIFDRILASKPFLGICLGLQAMYGFSEEGGGVECMGVLDGVVEHFGNGSGNEKFIDPATGAHLKVPHMGWNNVMQTQPHPLWCDIEQGQRFYFVHSYCVHSNDSSQLYGVTEYGKTFTAAGGRDNFFGVQFHPEKSQSAGLQLISNFITWDGSV